MNSNVCHCGELKKVSDAECPDCTKTTEQWLEVLKSEGNTIITLNEVICIKCKTKFQVKVNSRCPSCYK